MQRHERAKLLFLECCERDAGERARVLARECAEDEALRAEVEAMLAFEQRRPDFLEPGALARLRPLARSAPESLPDRIGKFRVLRRIGEGGMGTVFEVEQESPRRTVALKLLRRDLSSPRLVRRFEQEGELLGRLEHPGIARIYESGEIQTDSGPQPWLAMEVVHGVPLTQWARARRATPRECLELVALVCDAVQHAHERGVVHRDLKPANILVDDEGRPHVLDFGIARAMDSDVRLTTQHLGGGEIVGTLAYMSPEQAAGDSEAIDTRSDVYSLGVILHELLAGELPYPIAGRTLSDAVALIRDREPRRLGSVQRSLRGDVETIALTALEKDKRRRYASAADMAADLRHYLRDEPIGALPPSHTYVLRKFVRRNRTLVGAVAAVLLALTAGLVVALRFGLGEAEQRRRADQRTAQARSMAYQASILAAQKMLEGASFEAARAQLDATPEELRSWCFGALEHRLNPLLAELAVADVWNAAFLDDERVVAVDETGRVVYWDALSGAVRREEPQVPGARPLALAADGSRLLSWLGAELLLSELREGGATTRVPLPAVEPLQGWRRAAIAPGGRRVALATTDDALWLVELGSPARVERLPEAVEGATTLAFSADDRRLAVAGLDGVCLFDCEARRLLWRKRGPKTKVYGLAFDTQRGVLAAGGHGGKVSFFDLETGRGGQSWTPYQIKSQGSKTFDLAFVPGSSLVAVLFLGGELRLMDRETREVRERFTHAGTAQVSLAAAPGGAALLTCGREDDRIRLWRANPQPMERLDGESDPIYPLRISPDGSLAATGSWDGLARLWDLRSGRLIAALPHVYKGVDALDFSADGRLLACGSARAGLTLWDLRTGVALAVRPDVPATLVDCSPDGTQLAVAEGTAVRILDPRSLTERATLSSGAEAITALAWSDDGRLLAAGTKRSGLLLWDGKSGAELARRRELATERGQGLGTLKALAFSPDGARLATGWAGSQLLLFHVPDLAPAGELIGHSQEVFAVGWSPDGLRLASGGRDDHLRLWEPDSGGLLLDLAAHEDYVFSLAFSPDGRLLLTGSGDGTLGLWDSAPASLRWSERAQARRDRERLAPLVAALFDELGAAALVAERIETRPGLAPADRRLAWNLVLERAVPVRPAGQAPR